MRISVHGRLSLLFTMLVAMAMHAQQPSTERAAQLLKEFPELGRPDDPRRGGYARDLHIRKEVAGEIEKSYSDSLRRLDEADLALYLAETALGDAKSRLDTRVRELGAAEHLSSLAEAHLRSVEKLMTSNDPDRLRVLDYAREAYDPAVKTRDNAREQLEIARSELARAEAVVTPARTRYNEALAAEEQIRNARETVLKNAGYADDCAARGIAFQRNTIIVRFRDVASLLDIRRTLTQYQLSIRSGIPEISFFITEVPSIDGESETLVSVRVKRTVGLLRLESAVFSAVQQGTVGTTTVPPPSSMSSADPCWNWYNENCSGMVGAKNSRFPSAWSYNDAIRRRGRTPVSVAVLDEGFVDHEDLAMTSVCTTAQSMHGDLVAGILGASWANGKGIDGVTPFASLLACAPDLVEVSCEGANAVAFTSVLFALRRLIELQPRVINVSLGYNWVLTFGSVATPINRPDIMDFVAAQGGAFRDLLYVRDRGVIVVSAAGNDCVSRPDCKESAEWTSPLNWAALCDSADPIIEPAKNVFVVESVDADGKISTLSNKYGTLAAPGIYLLAPDGLTGQYTDDQLGTSLSAPIVSGLVALMLAYNPDLSVNRIRSILNVGQNEPPAAVDAFNAMVQSRDDALRDLADLTGDGKVDMADFEVFRSHLKQTESGVFTCDLNGDGLIDANDCLFPRSDLNGDGVLSRTATHAMPGFKYPMTDLQVMKVFWSDPKVKADDLDALLDK